MLSLAVQTIRGRGASLVGAFIAIFCGAAVITACGVLVDSGIRAGIPPERYAAASVVVGADQSLPLKGDISQRFAERVPLPADTVDRISAVPGVRSAIGDVNVSLGLLTAHSGLLGGVPLLGHGWSAAALGPFTLTSGHAPESPDDVVLDGDLAGRAGLRVGDTVRLVLGAVPTSYHVVGIAAVPPSGLARQSAVFLTDARARSLSGRPDQVDTVGVLATAGVDPDQLADRISTAVPGTVPYTGTERADPEFLDIGAARSFLIMLAGAFGGSMLMVVLFVVSSTLGLAMQQRRREFALLRAIAASPRQIHRLIGAETLMLGAVAAAVGAIPGFALSYLLRAAFAAAGAIPADFGFVLDPLPAVAAILLCVIAARVAGLIVARRVARINPVDALGEAAVERRELGRVRLLIGWLLVPLSVAAAIVVPLTVPGDAAAAGAGSSALLLVIAVALLGPRLLVGVTQLLGRLRLRRTSVGGFLAGANTRANARRLSSATTPLIMGVTLAAVQLFTMTTMAAAGQHQADTGVTADYVLTGTGGLAPQLTDTVRAVPGVAQATPVARTQVLITHQEGKDSQAAEPYAAQGVPAAGLSSVLDLDVRAGDIGDLTGDTVALSQLAAGTVGVGLGDRVTMHLGDGTAITPRVVALYRDGLGFGDVTLPHDVVLDHITTRLDTTVLVSARPGTDLGTLGGALRTAVRAYPTAQVSDRAAFSAAQSAQAGDSTVNLILDAVLLGYIAIAAANTLVMATASRVREFALLRLVGASPRQVRGMMRGEARMIVLTAIGIGTLIAVPPLVGISIGIAGTPLPSVPPLAYLAIIAVAAVLGWCCLTIPTRLAMRTRPVTAIGIRE